MKSSISRYAFRQRLKGVARVVSFLFFYSLNHAEDFGEYKKEIIYRGEMQLSYRQAYVRRLQKLKADGNDTEYPGVYHNSGINAFGEKDLLVWLFSHSKK